MGISKSVIYFCLIYYCNLGITTEISNNDCINKFSNAPLSVKSKACGILLERFKTSHVKELNSHEVKKIHFNQANFLYKLERFVQAKKTLFNLKSEFNMFLDDTESNYQWFYLVGKIKIRVFEYQDAILDFRDALKLAQILKNNQYIAHSLNGLGLGYQRLNQYDLALKAYKESLGFRIKYGNPFEIGVALNNIANVYKFLEDFENALYFYLKANKNYLMASNKKQQNNQVIAHSYENIGIVYNKLQQYKKSIIYLTKAKNIHDTGDLVTNKIQLLIYLAKSHLKLNNSGIAYEFYQHAIIEDDKFNDNNAVLRLELALYFYSLGNFDKTKLFIDQALDMADLKDRYAVIKPDIYLLKSKVSQKEKNYQAALEDHKIYTNLREKVLKNKSDQNILNVTHKIEQAQSQYELLLLEKENKLNAISINRQYWIIFSLILLALIIVIYVYQLLLKNKQEKNKLLKEVNQHKLKLTRLEGSKDQLKEMFKNTSDAILCINTAWVSIFHNKQFSKSMLGGNQKVDGIKLKNLMPDLFNITSELPLNDHDMPLSVTINDFEVTIEGNVVKFNIQINTINLLDDFTIFAFGNDELPNFETQLVNATVNERTNKITQDDYRCSLVELMQNCVRIWNAHTQTNRIELAEASGFWNVSIDDGRLRTRAMDRYLDLKHLPINPRWRQVVKTAHYILAEHPVDSVNREKLNALLEAFMNAKKLLLE